MPAETRDRIVNASADLFRRQGYTGTGLKQIATEARAPFGSIYHFFPGGKAELGEETIRVAGEFFRRLVAEVMNEPAGDPVENVGNVFTGAAETLVATDYADACPIETIALEVASTDDRLRAATADVFSSWIDSGTRWFESLGLSRETARELALGMICALEGAFVLSRAARTTEPLLAAGEAAKAQLRAALAGGAG
ncbi:MAG: TetR/AcrR family transcriptional regulator [Solirubrobacterales bacterium]